MSLQPDARLRALFEAALEAADPMKALPAYLPDPAEAPKGRTIVLGAGKASAAMAAALEAHWQAQWPRPLEGRIITRYGHATACRHITIVEAAHPVPDEAGLAATAEILALADGAGEDDLVICLISGGGSSLLCAPAGAITLADKQVVNRALLKSGATISEMNTVRKHLSAVKGGRLAMRAAPARMVTLLISDVPGDDPAAIASSPTVADPTTRRDAQHILKRYGIAVPAAVSDHLERPEAETPKPDNPAFAANRVALVATPQMALEQAAARARDLGLDAHILSDRIEGEARDVAQVLAAVALQVAGRRQPFAPPCVLLSGGETTVTIKGDGRGGRNVEFLLALAIALDGAAGIHAIACDTDGVDGREPVAGAVIGPDTLARAEAAGLDPEKMLDDNDAHTFFERLGDQVVTGPTLTNVNDFRAILIEPL